MWQLRNTYWFFISLSSRINSKKQQLKSCIKKHIQRLQLLQKDSTAFLIVQIPNSLYQIFYPVFSTPSPVFTHEITAIPWCSISAKTLSTHKRSQNLTESLTFLTSWFWRNPGVIFFTGNYLCSNHEIALITLKHNRVLVPVGRSKSRYFSPIFNSEVFTLDHWKRGNIC